MIPILVITLKENEYGSNSYREQNFRPDNR